MPELPEVELVVRSLDSLVKHKTISSAHLLRKKLAPTTTPKQFAKLLAGSSVKRLHRRGKHILIDLDSDKTLIVHLRMTGRFMLLPLEAEEPKFSHAIFYFSDDTKMIFEDQRHFGFMKIVNTQDVSTAKEIAKLAPEPFSEAFSVEYVKSELEQSKRAIKEFLLDQTKVCGLGNIYAAEAMFLARVHPTVRAENVSAIKARRLHRFIIEVLEESIEYSSTLNVDPENFEENYYGGGYGHQWRVYDRENEPCVNCKTSIRRFKQGGRSSYFCPRCQRK